VLSTSAAPVQRVHRMKSPVCEWPRLVQSACSSSVAKRFLSSHSTASNVVDVSVQNFQQVFAEKVTFIIACYMPQDQISSAVVARLESAIREYPSLKLARIDVDSNREMIEALSLEVVPTVLVYSNQRVLDKITGDMSPEKVNELLSRLAGAEEKVSVLERIKKANQMYSQGEFVGALETYKDILQQEEEGSENGAMCLAGLAMCALALEDANGAVGLVEQLKEKYSRWLESPMVKQAVTGVNMSIEARKMGGSVEEFQAIVTENPDDMKAREKLAVLLFSQQEYSEAIEQALYIFNKDKNKAEGNGRNLLLR